MIFPRSFYSIPAGGTAETVRLVGRNADIELRVTSASANDNVVAAEIDLVVVG